MPDPTAFGWSLSGGKHHGPLAFSRLWGRTSESDSSFHEPEQPTTDYPARDLSPGSWRR